MHRIAISAPVRQRLRLLRMLKLGGLEYRYLIGCRVAVLLAKQLANGRQRASLWMMLSTSRRSRGAVRSWKETPSQLGDSLGY